MALAHTRLNGYVASFNSKQADIYATSLYAAKLQAISKEGPFGGIPKSKQGLLAIALAEKNGKPVIHDPSIL